MAVPRKPLLEEIKGLRKSLKTQTKDKDVEKISYLFFERLFSIEAIEQFFKGKYTYKEIRDIVRGEYLAYYRKEKENGR